MYLREKKIKLLRIKNTLFVLFGAFNIVLSGEYIVSMFTYYRDNPNTALHAVSMPSSVVWFIIGVILLIAAAVSWNRIGNVAFYSSYFEGDLDGYITYSDLAAVTGKSIPKIRKELHLFRRHYMKHYELKEKNGKEMVELDSKKALCECKNCGAHIEKRMFFTGTCPYCDSSDLSARVLTNDRFYSISNDFKLGVKNPSYYTARLLNARKVLYIVLSVISAILAVCGVCMVFDGIGHYFDQEYQKEILLSSENHLFSYVLIKADILNNIIFDAAVTVLFAPLAFLLFRKACSAGTAGICSDFLSKSRKPFAKASSLPDLGIVTDEKRKLKEVRAAIHRGYLVHCTLEMHDGELMTALAKKIVKDQCPSCAAPIVDAVDENYKCQYCGRLIMDVIEKK